MYNALKRGLTCLLVWACLFLTPAVTAFGAADKIDTVKLTFSYDRTPKAGEEAGTVEAKSTSRAFTVERAEYTNNTRIWELGDRPEVTVTLSAAQGFRFSYTSSGHFKLSGCGAEFDRARVRDNGGTLVLEVLLKTVEGKLGEPQDLEWDGTYAMWSKLDNAREYEVRLYRNKSQIETVTTRNTSYDFCDKITRQGDYAFRVRGISRYDSKAGSWSGYSDGNSFTGGGALDSARGTWIQNQTGWWYRYGNGDYPTDCWKQIKGVWYYFNGDGYMLNGWQRIDGRWYYLDGSGAMATGWQFINGRWYYLERNGAMAIGWKLLDGRWYYLDGNGAMAVDWQLINGNWYYLDGSGAMVTGWRFINGWWRYLEQDGAMAVGWRYLDGAWYFLDGNGVMLTGWQYINGYWYYLGGNGAMLSAGWTADGYYVGESGRWDGAIHR